MEELKEICRGISVSTGIVHGRILKLGENNGHAVTKNDILVLESSNPLYAIEVMSAGGVIMERGGRLAHLCVIALEMGIPCITQAEKAGEILMEGQAIVLDAAEGVVYEQR